MSLRFSSATGKEVIVQELFFVVTSFSYLRLLILCTGNADHNLLGLCSWVGHTWVEVLSEMVIWFFIGNILSDGNTICNDHKKLIVRLKPCSYIEVRKLEKNRYFNCDTKTQCYVVFIWLD